MVLRGKATCDMVTLVYACVATSLAAMLSHLSQRLICDVLPGWLLQVLLQGTCLVEESILSGEVRASANVACSCDSVV